MGYAFWGKSGKKLAFDKATVDFVEEDVADFPNSFTPINRDAGFSWYEYRTERGDVTHTNLDKKVICVPRQAGIIRGRKPQREY